MDQIKRTWERLSDEEKNLAKEELILFFERERDEKIGIIAAEEIINFFLQSVGSKLYNKGVSDAKKALKTRIEELNYDLDDLIDLQFIEPVVKKRITVNTGFTGVYRAVETAVKPADAPTKTVYARTKTVKTRAKVADAPTKVVETRTKAVDAGTKVAET